MSIPPPYIYDVSNVPLEAYSKGVLYVSDNELYSISSDVGFNNTKIYRVGNSTPIWTSNDLSFYQGEFVYVSNAEWYFIAISSQTIILFKYNGSISTQVYSISQSQYMRNISAVKYNNSILCAFVEYDPFRSRVLTIDLSSLSGTFTDVETGNPGTFTNLHNGISLIGGVPYLVTEYLSSNNLTRNWKIKYLNNSWQNVFSGNVEAPNNYTNWESKIEIIGLPDINRFIVFGTGVDFTVNNQSSITVNDYPANNYANLYFADNYVWQVSLYTLYGYEGLISYPLKEFQLGLGQFGYITGNADSSRLIIGTTDTASVITYCSLLKLGHLPPAQIETTLTPTAIHAGESATLTWNITNADHATLNDEPISLSGSRQVSPAQTTDYVFGATKDGYTSQITKTLTFLLPEPEFLVLSASKTTIVVGEKVTLTWEIANATAATLNGQGIAMSGSREVSPTEQDHEYHFATSNGQTSIVQTISITVLSGYFSKGLYIHKEPIYISNKKYMIVVYPNKSSDNMFIMLLVSESDIGYTLFLTNDITGFPVSIVVSRNVIFYQDNTAIKYVDIRAHIFTGVVANTPAGTLIGKYKNRILIKDNTSKPYWKKIDGIFRVSLLNSNHIQCVNWSGSYFGRFGSTLASANNSMVSLGFSSEEIMVKVGSKIRFVKKDNTLHDEVWTVKTKNKKFLNADVTAFNTGVEIFLDKKIPDDVLIVETTIIGNYHRPAYQFILLPTQIEEVSKDAVNFRTNRIENSDYVPIVLYSRAVITPPITGTYPNFSIPSSYVEGYFDSSYRGDFEIEAQISPLNSGNILYMSAEGAIEDWEIQGFMGAESSIYFVLDLPIRAIAYFMDSLLIATTENILALIGNNISDMRVSNNLQFPIGTINQNTVVSFKNNLFVLSEKGLFYSQNAVLTINALNPYYMTEKVKRTFEDIDFEKANEIALSSFKTYLLIRFFSKIKQKICFLVLNTNNENKDLYSVIDNLAATSLYNHGDSRLLYGSENSTNLQYRLCEYNIENTKEFTVELLDTPSNIESQILTKRYSPGTECQFKELMIKACGHGEVIVTIILDGRICDLPLNSPPVPGHRRGEKLHFFFDDDTHAEEQYAPRANNPFRYIGHDIQLLVECNGAGENITIYPPQIGYMPLKLKEGGKRSGGAISYGYLF